jgi:hypothetical protein
LGKYTIKYGIRKSKERNCIALTPSIPGDSMHINKATNIQKTFVTKYLAKFG